MNRSVDQKVADSALTNEVVDQKIDVTMCKSGDVTDLTLVGDAGAIMAAFGVWDPDFLFGLIHQVGNAASKREYERVPDERGIKFMLAFIKSRRPRDGIDAMLVAQMAATHVATMRFANRLAHVESLQERDSAERTYNKLARTFVAQVEALQRYRDVSSQNVIVQQHVFVGDGGQPIVKNVTGPAHDRSLPGRLPLAPALQNGQPAPMEIIGERRRVPVPRRRRKG